MQIVLKLHGAYYMINTDQIALYHSKSSKLAAYNLNLKSVNFACFFIFPKGSER